MNAGKKILIVDDDPINIFSLSAALEDEGFEVLSAGGGAEGIEILDSNGEIGLVLMDIQMPEMDGYEAMDRIRKRNEYQDLAIIALTAKAMVGDREKCLEAGASDYCSKPVNMDLLVQMMRSYL